MKFLNVTLLFFLFLLPACLQKQPTPAEKYFRFLNNYQGDKLQHLLADDFKVKSTYTNYVYNRADFFKIYLRNYRVYNQKSDILKTISDGEPQIFLIEDNSDYLKYLDVDPPRFKVTVTSANQKVIEVHVDTTETSREYFRTIKEKSELFRSWLHMQYPAETPQVLHETKGLFLKRLKEYSEILIKP